ncbi:hypothetical protein [Bradyrhizobium retamae]|uniref:Uncharacterized protein n=1 Tax=Bradyrhizobium retamae TaxID=1300035 RepID=A0A0R3N1U3_9BRAD|nr:hypothetical protein [Bradyrhizobium retamae]KRR25950.1 hypothetical protein CQ13_23285 [Bradyrhizobium retamae]
MRTSPATSIIPSGARSFGRRPLKSFAGHVTCLMLFRHDETDTDVLVSDDGDAGGAVWLPKALLSIDRADRSRFLVVTLSQRTAHQHQLSTRIIDRTRFTHEERADLEDAITTAARARKRLSGREDARPFPGRNAFA